MNHLLFYLYVGFQISALTEVKLCLGCPASNEDITETPEDENSNQGEVTEDFLLITSEQIDNTHFTV